LKRREGEEGGGEKGEGRRREEEGRKGRGTVGKGRGQAPKYMRLEAPLLTDHEREDVAAAAAVAGPRRVDVRLVDGRLTRDLIAGEVDDGTVGDADCDAIVGARTTLVQLLTLHMRARTHTQAVPD